MQLLIKRMEIENFKGVKHLVIDFSPTHTDISGANGSGKTTIPDAFNWLMHNKDSKGNAPGSSNFTEKPLDESGQEIHNLTTTVAIEAMLDGARFYIKRTQEENWVKKRGAEDAIYSGNISTYYINEVETKQTDFRKRIAEIVPEEVSRLVSTMGAFNQTEWKKRRELLLEMSGVDADAVLLQQQEYSEIAAFTQERNVSVEDMRKIYMERKRNIEQDLKLLPIRIDEATKAIPQVTTYAISEMVIQQEKKRGEIAAIDARIISAKSDDPREARNARMAKLQADKQQAERNIKDDYSRAMTLVSKVRNENAEAQRELETRIERTQNSIDLLARQADTTQTLVDDWRIQYREAFKQTLTYEAENECPTCGQAISKEILELRADEAKAKFDKDKEAALQRISAQGKLESERLDAIKQTAEEEKENLKALEARLADAKEAAESAQEAYNKEMSISLTERIASDITIQGITAQIDALFDEPMDSRAEAEIEQLNAQRKALNDELFAIGAELQAAKQGEATKDRIKQLESEMTAAGQRLNEAEQTIALIERFIQDRCGTLEEAINNLFPTVRWKLFDIQINGGISETCQCMIPCASGLVPYESANTAAAIHADVEIINVLSNHFKAQMPIFLDNNERLNHIPETAHQIITLTVNTEKGLTINHH
jgi:chromosome segregation ATPase